MVPIDKLIKYWWQNLTDDPTNHFSGPKIVAIGGGTGLATLLRGLKKYSRNITAIVTMSDDGASSGQLRKEMASLPPGDIRQCLTALSEEEPLLSELFQYRFDNVRGLAGHSFGNLFIAALEKISGSFEKAIELASKILAISGQVMPSTLSDIKLGAELSDGQMIYGESKIPLHTKDNPIKRVFLQPAKVNAYGPALIAIEKADIILIGPGSLYSSIIPNFLISDMAAKIRESKAQKIYIANISTERGETEGMDVESHIAKLSAYAGRDFCDITLVNSKILKNEEEGELGKIKNITIAKKSLGKIRIVKADVVANANPLYHNSDKLAKKIMAIYLKR